MCSTLRAGGILSKIGTPPPWLVVKLRRTVDQCFGERGERVPDLLYFGCVDPVVPCSGAFGQQHPRFRWTRILSGPTLRQALGAAADPLVSPLQLKVLERGASGRVLALQISGSSDAAPVILKLDAIRRTLRTLPSTLFVLEPQGGEHWLLVGGGFGHGAGLSQAGAIDLAWRGWPVERILSHYYPGTVYGPLSTLVQSP